MAAKSSQPSKFRKAKDVTVGDSIFMILKVAGKNTWELHTAAAMEITAQGWYRFTSADGASNTFTGNEYVEGQF